MAWATEALDQVRRAMVARLRANGHHDEATALKASRWALLKNPPNLTGDQRTTLAGIAKANGGLYRAYLLKEQLRAIFQAVELADARALLGGWIAWARRCRLDPFVKLVLQQRLEAVQGGAELSEGAGTSTPEVTSSAGGSPVSPATSGPPMAPPPGPTDPTSA